MSLSIQSIGVPSDDRSRERKPRPSGGGKRAQSLKGRKRCLAINEPMRRYQRTHRL